MKKLLNLPNILTLCNLLCGCAAVGNAFFGYFPAAFCFIIGGAVFDFFDGFAARALGISGPIGKELDSLADVITFGFAPAAMVFVLLQGILAPTGFGGLNFLTFSAYLIAAFSALRLAKFNTDERQTMGFIGLPTPANALFWAALSCALSGGGICVFYGLIALVLLSCWLLISEIPMFALKFKHFQRKGNELRIGFASTAALFLVAGLVIGLYFKQAFVGFCWGVVAVIVLYIVLSLLTNHKQGAAIEK